MALQNELEEILDRVARALSIISFLKNAKVTFQDNPDLEIELTPAVKQTLQGKRDQLVNQIKTRAAAL